MKFITLTYICNQEYMVSYPFDNDPIKAKLIEWGMVYNSSIKQFTISLAQEQHDAIAHSLVNLGKVIFKAKSNSVETSPISAVRQEESHKASQRMAESLIRRQFAYSTRKTYLNAFNHFLTHFKDADIDSLTKIDIEGYLLKRVEEDHISESYQNTIINAIKYYYERVLGRERTYYVIDRPQKRDILPKVLSQDEISKMIKLTVNIKHQCMLMLLYGCGLRLSEVTNLIPSDIDSKRMMLTVRQSKGKKDRYVPLSTKLLDRLRTHYKENQPLTFLFEGDTVGEPYSTRSLQSVVKQAADRAGIYKTVTAHMLRHSYATHLLENGTNIRYIQDLLGHNSIKTTERYTHVAKNNKPASPLDNMDI